MGQSQNIIIASGPVSAPAANQHFALISHGDTVEVVYRNLSFHVPAPVFRDCALQFKGLSLEEIMAFPYGSGRVREVFSFSGLPPLPAEAPAVRVQSKGGKHLLRHRFLTVELSEPEWRVISPHLASEGMRGLFRRLFRPAAPIRRDGFSMELRENVRIHFQNFRLEFSPGEFAFIFDFCSSLNLQHFLDNPGMSAMTNTLPPRTEWNERFQIEGRGEGQYLVHYRNLRVALHSLQDAGVLLTPPSPPRDSTAAFGMRNLRRVARFYVSVRSLSTPQTGLSYSNGSTAS